MYYDCKYYQRDGVIFGIDTDGSEIKSNPCLAVSKVGNRLCKLNFGISMDRSCSPMQGMKYCKCDAIVGLYDFDFIDIVFFEYFIVNYKNKKMYIK